jgi:hypothetical protein
MRWKKKTKNIDEISVAKLLDDFVDLDVEADDKRKEMNDDEYIRMMVEKEEKRKRVRAKKTAGLKENGDAEAHSEGLVEESTKKQIETIEEVFPATCEHDLSPEDEADIEEIVKTQDMMDEPALTGRMKASVKSLQGEMKSSEAKHATRKTFEKSREKIADSGMKKTAPIVSEKRTPIKRCQNCYFCVGERKISGSCWCHCTNPARSTHAVVRGSWVKSRMNLPCWKVRQE